MQAQDKFVYSASNLVLTENSITDPLRTQNLSDMPNTYPANKTKLINPTPMTERAWCLALRDAETNIVTSPDGKKYFGAGKTFGMTVYTRDISYSGVLGLNKLYPEIMKSSLEYSRNVRLTLGLTVPAGQTIPEINGNWIEDTTPGTFINKYKTHPYTRRTDDVVWVWAAYDLFENNPGLADWQWLYDKITDSFSILYEPFYDSSDGLFHGQASFIDVHNADGTKTTGYPHDYSMNDCILVKATSTNSLYYMAHKCMAKVCEKLGKNSEASGWLTKAEALREAMLSTLRFADGTFTYYKDKNGNLQPRREALGTALAVITGVVEGEDARNCLAGYPVSWAGVQLLYPFFPDISGVYHNNTAWPFVDTFFLWAKEMAEEKDYTSQSAAMLTRCTYGGSFREIVNWNTKEPARSQSQLWTAAGFINVCLRAGIVGEIIPPPVAYHEPKDVWFDIDFSTDEWLDACSSVLQNAGKNPYDIRTLTAPAGIDIGTVTINDFIINGNVYKEENPFTSVCGKTFQYAVRLRNNKPSYIEFPAVDNAGRIILYVRNNNANNAGTIDVGLRVNAGDEPDIEGDWKPDYPLMQWEVPGNASYAEGTSDLKFAYDIDINQPVALRIYRNTGYFVDVFRIVLGKYGSEDGTSIQPRLDDKVKINVVNRTVYLSKVLNKAKLSIHDISGRLLFGCEVSSDTIPLNNIKSGIYILKLVTAQNEITKKAII
jgi:hypothetical protein